MKGGREGGREEGRKQGRRVSVGMGERVRGGGID